MDLQERKQILEAQFEEVKQNIIVREDGIKKLQGEIDQLLIEIHRIRGQHALLEELLGNDEDVVPDPAAVE